MAIVAPVLGFTPKSHTHSLIPFLALSSLSFLFGSHCGPGLRWLWYSVSALLMYIRRTLRWSFILVDYFSFVVFFFLYVPHSFVQACAVAAAEDHHMVLSFGQSAVWLSFLACAVPAVSWTPDSCHLASTLWVRMSVVQLWVILRFL